MGKSKIYFVTALITISNLVLFFAYEVITFRIPIGEYPFVGIFSEPIGDFLIFIFPAVLLLFLNAFFLLFISRRLQSFEYERGMLISKLYLIFSVIFNVPFYLALLARILISPPAGLITISYLIIGLFLYIPLFFSPALLFWGLWFWFRNKIRNRLVLMGIILSLVTLLVGSIYIYQVTFKTACDKKSGQPCIITNPL